MKVLGCFKEVPDLEMISESEWKEQSGSLPETKFLKTVYSSFDESTLELILRAKDECEEELLVEVLTVKTDSRFMKTDLFYAMGYDQVTEIVNQTEADTATIISQYAGQNPDIKCIVMGEQSVDNGGCITPYETAEMLGWNCISGVTELKLMDSDHVQVKQQTQLFERIFVVQLPCVLVVGNVQKTFLRIPTLKQKLACKGKIVNKTTVDSLENDIMSNNNTLTKLEYLDHSRKSEEISVEDFEKLLKEIEIS